MVTLIYYKRNETILRSHSFYDQFFYFFLSAYQICLPELGITFSVCKSFRSYDEDGYCQRHDVHQKIYRTHRTYPPGLGFLFDHLFKPAERAAAAFVPEVTVAELVPAAWIHYEFIDNERCKPFVQLKDAEIEIDHIADTLEEVYRFVERRIQKLTTCSTFGAKTSQNSFSLVLK